MMLVELEFVVHGHMQLVERERSVVTSLWVERVKSLA